MYLCRLGHIVSFKNCFAQAHAVYDMGSSMPKRLTLTQGVNWMRSLYIKARLRDDWTRLMHTKVREVVYFGLNF